LAAGVGNLKAKAIALVKRPVRLAGWLISRERKILLAGWLADFA